MKTQKPKRMFVMAEVEATGLTAKEVDAIVQSRLAGHPHVEVLQVDVNVSRPRKVKQLNEGETKK